MANVLQIVKLDGKTLTFAIPPGQRKYSRHMFESKVSEDTKAEAKSATTGGDEDSSTNVHDRLGTDLLVPNTETNGDEATEASTNRDGSLITEEVPKTSTPPGGSRDAAFVLDKNIDEPNAAEDTVSENNGVKANNGGPDDATPQAAAPEEEQPNGESPPTNRAQSSALASQEAEDDVLHSVSSLTQLEHTIIDIDGRFKSKDLAVQNAWKNFRGIRDNQDLGSLFEMREEFFVYKHPQIVKQPKRKR